MQQKILIPPIKCQGIKSKIVPFIREHVKRNPEGIWIEPFLDSGVVAFNMAPKKALLTDKNRHTIAFYQGIQNGTITPAITEAFLTEHGEKLRRYGEPYYRLLRDDFNETGDPLTFLFLNRAGFNGMIRFNRQGKLNVPFCKKPNRFAKAYVTKICHQVQHVAEVMQGKDWTFDSCDWRETLKTAKPDDYLYLDPPYIGRDTSYVGEWSEKDATDLARMAKASPASVCLSMWKENAFRKNEHLYTCWSDFTWFEFQHFYHIGASEKNRHPMVEVLAIS